MDPLLLVIVSFGLIFVVTASLGQGLGVARASMGPPLKAHSQLNIMLLISTFVVVPAILIGLGALLPFAPKVKMAIVVLAICGGAPFVPWLVSLAKGNVGYGAAATTVLLIATFIVLPLAVPPLESALGTNADVTAWKILWPLLVFMLLPFLIGVLIRARSLSLTMALGSWLGPVSITFLMAHIVLFIGYSWSDFVRAQRRSCWSLPPRFQDRVRRGRRPAEHRRRHLLRDLRVRQVHRRRRHDAARRHRHNPRRHADHGRARLAVREEAEPGTERSRSRTSRRRLSGIGDD